jgi:hypothetical protein
MKISGSTLIVDSSSHSDQMESSVYEKKLKARPGQDIVPERNIQDLSRVFVDRVSISQQHRQEYQSNYSAVVSGRSSVSSTEPHDTIEFQQKMAVEKLVGGIIDRDVAIRSIQRRQDIQLSDPAISVQKISDRAMWDREKSNPALSNQDFAVSDKGFAGAWQMSLQRTDLYFEAQTIEFASSGRVITEDGRTIDFSLDMFLDRAFLSRTEQETMVVKWQERANLTDPLVISLDGNVPRLSDVEFEFDLNNDGKTENIARLGSGSGFLSFDKNNDGVINNGSELFGPGTGNGFEELAAFDGDGNRWIDENDDVFSRLSVWTKDETGEDVLVSLKDTGVGAIALDTGTTPMTLTTSGNQLLGQLKSTGVFLFENGRVGAVHQIDLASRPLETPANESNAVPEADRPPLKPLNVPSRLSFPSVMEESRSDEASAPLQDLLDRIERLKQKMETLMGKMNPGPHQDGFGGSKYRGYSGLNPGPSFLLFGRSRNGRNRGRFA